MIVNGKSTLSNISESIDIIKEYLMDGNNVDIMYLDFSLKDIFILKDIFSS